MTTAAEHQAPELWVPRIAWGDRIRIVRRGLDMSQEQFATLLGIGKQRLSAWESGNNRPADAVEMAQLIEARTGVPATWMLGLNQPEGGGGMARSERFSCSSRAPRVTRVTAGGPHARLHRPDRISAAAS